MKINTLIRSTVAALLLALTGSAQAADSKAKDAKADKAKPYPLEKCVVSDEKLGDHGTPHVFKHEGREVKLCCKGCLKDFKKDSAKYIKKIEEAEKAK
jgi:hypothetical protein